VSSAILTWSNVVPSSGGERGCGRGSADSVVIFAGNPGPAFCRPSTFNGRTRYVLSDSAGLQHWSSGIGTHAAITMMVRLSQQ